MAAARITAAQARALGIDVAGKKRTTRRVAHGEPYHTECCVCLERFTTAAAEDRHLDAHPDHRRYRLVWGTPEAD